MKMSCVPERMLFTVKQFAVKTGQRVKVVFTNPDATDHNLSRGAERHRFESPVEEVEPNVGQRPTDGDRH